MCSEPVTLGGGITMEHMGPGALGSARNSCSCAQNSAQRGSICCGSQVLAISRAIRCDTPGGTRGILLRRAASYVQSNLRLYGAESSIVNSDAQRVVGCVALVFHFKSRIST